MLNQSVPVLTTTAYFKCTGEIIRFIQLILIDLRNQMKKIFIAVVLLLVASLKLFNPTTYSLRCPCWFTVFKFKNDGDNCGIFITIYCLPFRENQHHKFLSINE